MNIISTWKIFKSLFYNFFVSNRRWLWLSILFTINTALSYIVFKILINSSPHKNVLDYFKYFLDVYTNDLIIVAVFNMVSTNYLLSHKNDIVNYLKKSNSIEIITDEVFLTSSYLILATVFLYLSLPQLIWPVIQSKLTTTNILSYLLILISYIFYNIFTSVSIELSFSHSVNTKLTVFIVNFLVNFFTLSLISDFKKDMGINYTTMFILMTILTSYNYRLAFKEIKHYRISNENSLSEVSEILPLKELISYVLIMLIFKFKYLLHNIPSIYN